MDTIWTKTWTVWKGLFSGVGSAGPMGALPVVSLQQCTWSAAETWFHETKCFSQPGMIKALSDSRSPHKVIRVNGSRSVKCSGWCGPHHTCFRGIISAYLWSHSAINGLEHIFWFTLMWKESSWCPLRLLHKVNQSTVQRKTCLGIGFIIWITVLM